MVSAIAGTGSPFVVRRFAARCSIRGRCSFAMGYVEGVCRALGAQLQCIHAQVE